MVPGRTKHMDHASTLKAKKRELYDSFVLLGIHVYPHPPRDNVKFQDLFVENPSDMRKDLNLFFHLYHTFLLLQRLQDKLNLLRQQAPRLKAVEFQRQTENDQH